MRLWSRINGGCGIRVNLLGTHGPGFVSKAHFGCVEGNENDTGGKTRRTKSVFSHVLEAICCLFFFAVDIEKAGRCSKFWTRHFARWI